MTETPNPSQTRGFSRRTRATLLTGAALALLGGSAALAVPALAASTNSTRTSAAVPTPISTPVGGAASTAKLTAPVGALLSTTTNPVKCTAGPSGVITFAANSSDAIGRVTATGDTVCTANPTDAAYLTHTTPTDANADTSLAWNPTADVSYYGTAADASGCLMIYGGDASVANGLANGELTGDYRIPAATPATWVEFAGACQLHAGTTAS